jgi:NAD(P)-dependent dehydrogenase (short-subunit alcohol dehydrogenase family)
LNEHADAEETRRHIQAEGGRCLLLPGDVKDETYCQRAVAQVVAEFGKLDILVNNAAFQEHADALEDISTERLDETVHTNVYGYFFMAKAALPHLGAGSSIINSGSVVGLRGSAAWRPSLCWLEAEPLHGPRQTRRTLGIPVPRRVADCQALVHGFHRPVVTAFQA